MGNQQAATIIIAIERIEKRMTALQERGIDISALSSQVLIAREMLNDERYEDADVFCQELIELADKIADNNEQAAQRKIRVETDDDDEEGYRRQETKRFSTSDKDLNQQLQNAVEVGLLEQLRQQNGKSSLLNEGDQEALQAQISKMVSDEVLHDLMQRVPSAESKRIERALADICEREVLPSEGDGDALPWVLAELIRKSVQHALQGFEHNLGTHIEKLTTSNEVKTDAHSVQIVNPNGQTGSNTMDKEQEQDTGSFMGLPRIPRHGEPLDDDSSFQNVVVESDSIYQAETESNNQDESGYEPVTGSMLRPNTSVFTESNDIRPPTAKEIHTDSQAPDTKQAFKLMAEMINNQQGQQTQAAGPVDKQDMKRMLREMLPELLQEDDIKQAIFACLAIETVTKPSVLGSLTGLREYLRRELQVVQESLQDSSHL